jgi:hypothetical protein
MNFAVPSAILLAALALPIIAFYILKVRMRRIPVSTNLFWKQIFDERPPRSLWQNFRHLFSLLAQLFILGALILAFADPYFSWQLLQARRLVLVVDPSASMKSTDVSPTRFEAAIQEGMSIVEGLRFRDELAIVVAGPTPEVAVGMTGHIPTLRRALSQLQPTDNPTSLTDALQLAKQLVGDHQHRQVVVLTDGCDNSVRDDGSKKEVVLDTTKASEASSDSHSANNDSEPTHEIDVQYRIFATKASNVGIHQFQVRRSLIDPIGYEILVGVLNASDTPIRCRLELELEGSIVDVVPLELKPNEKWSRAIEKTSMEGGTLAAKLTKIQSSDSINAANANTTAKRDSGKSGSEESDAKWNSLLIDDQAWAILPAREVQKVLIVTPGNLFLTKVFQANPLVDVTTVKEIPASWPENAILVLHQLHPEVIPDGNVLIIDPLANSDLWEQGGVVENPIITEIDKSSPLMHHIRLDNVLMPETKQLKFIASIKSLAGTLDKTSVLAELRRESGKCLVLSVDLDKSDLAFRTVFPILVANALGWYSGNVGELRESQSTGNAKRVALKQAMNDLPAESTLFLRSPTNLEILIPKPSATTDESVVPLGPFQETGVWSVIATREPKGDASNKKMSSEEPIVLTQVAVNLSNANETDLRPADSMLKDRVPTVLASGWFSKPIWYYLVAFAAALVAIEWFLYQRRIIT